jgi:hypothetical protein
MLNCLAGQAVEVRTRLQKASEKEGGLCPTAKVTLAVENPGQGQGPAADQVPEADLGVSLDQEGQEVNLVPAENPDLDPGPDLDLVPDPGHPRDLGQGRCPGADPGVALQRGAEVDPLPGHGLPPDPDQVVLLGVEVQDLKVKGHRLIRTEEVEMRAEGRVMKTVIRCL